MTTSFDPFEFENSHDSTTLSRIRQREATAPAEIKMARASWLDSVQAAEMHRKGMALYQREVERHRPNRLEQAEDHDFYDNLQFTPGEIDEIEGRGQIPVTYNVIGTTVDWVLGTEKRLRTDYKILPREKEGAALAEAKTDAMKVVNDGNHTRFSRSMAFKDAVVGGVGWVEDAISDDDTGELMESGYETWRAMHWDSLSRQPDLNKDARFLSRTKWLDYDVGCRWFPKRKSIIETATLRADETGAMDLRFGDEAMDVQEMSGGMLGAGMDTEFGYSRQRFKSVELWFRRAGEIKKLKGGQFAGELYDPWSRGHTAEIEAGKAEIMTRPGMELWCLLMTVSGLLWAGRTPYRHNRFPFTPVWGYRRDSDAMPYGLVRRVKSLQRKINMQKTKELAIMATNKVVMDEGAVDNLDDFLEEVSRHDAVIVKKQGKELILDADRQLAPVYGDMARSDIGMVQSVGGVTDENRGVETNAKSGIAIERRQDQGALATSLFFDNLLMARLLQGEKQLSLIEQFYVDQRLLRVMNERGTAQFRVINSGAEDDITRSKADFVISEDEYRATVRQAKFEELWKLLSEIAPVAPEIALNLLDLAFEASDFPNRDEMVKRIRQLSGQDDPDAAEPSPEAKAKQEAQAKAQERIERLEEATIAQTEADAAAKKATAAATGEKIARERVGTQKDALDGALVLGQAPQLAPVADVILNEAGFKGTSEKQDDSEIEDKAQQLERIALEGFAKEQEAAAAAGAVPPEESIPPAEGGQ